MYASNWKVFPPLAAFFISIPSLVEAAGGLELLWEIGKPDNDTAEFALGRKGYGNFEKDGFFVVGHSDPGRDWPYTHPGPDDGWAGGGSHTFLIVFALSKKPEGSSRLDVDLADTHGRSPPPLEIRVNGHPFRHPTPPGGGDASIFGNPSAGKEHRFSLDIPAGNLRVGVNEITITISSGSWILYDWLGFFSPPGTELKPSDGTAVKSVRVDPWLSRRRGELRQRISVEVLHVGKEAELNLEAAGESARFSVRPGFNTGEIYLPPVQVETPLAVAVRRDGQTISEGKAVRGPAVEREPVDYVDPLIGTATSRWMLYPGPSTPFSMVYSYPAFQECRWLSGLSLTMEKGVDGPG